VPAGCIGASAIKEANLALDAFPSPADLWARYRAWKGLTPEAEQIVLQDYFDDGSDKAPRYYQVNAVNAAIEAIAKGRDRILLVMATGTGNTYTAFQIIWRLWKAGRKKRILYLADRNVLIDQTMVNDFRPFGAAMAKLLSERGSRHGYKHGRLMMAPAGCFAILRYFQTRKPVSDRGRQAAIIGSFTGNHAKDAENDSMLPDLPVSLLTPCLPGLISP
jgi:hypothetical protein